MSRMENNVKPLLNALVHAHQNWTLSRADQKRLAQWLYLKSLIFSLTVEDIEIPLAEFTRFYRSRKPPQLAHATLTAADVPSKPGGLFRMDIVAGGQTWRGLIYSGYVILQIFGDSAFWGQLIPYPVRKSDGVLFRIWPPDSPISWLPSKCLSDEGIEQLLDLFSDSTGSES